MYPDAETRTNFKYPCGGLMQLRDFVKDGELRHPTMLDANGEYCLIVVKNGATTGVALGRATGIESFVREYKDYAISSTFYGDRCLLLRSQGWRFLRPWGLRVCPR